MAQASLSRHVRSSTLVNQATGEEFTKLLLQTIHNKNIDVLLPIGSESVFEVAKNRDMFTEKVQFALPPQRSLDLALNKSETLMHAQSIGIACPKSFICFSQTELEQLLPTLSLPLVIKSASELSKFGPHYLHTSEHVDNVLARVDLQDTILETPMIVQEIIKGPGVGFFALYQSGECKRAFMHQRIRESPSTGGSSWAAKGINRSDLFEAGKALLDSLAWHGPAMVEFKLDSATDHPTLMELNPKFWGSLDLSILSGVDFPSDTVRVATGDVLEASFEFQSGKNFVWPLEEPVKYLFDKELRKIKHETNVKISDPLPSIYQVLQRVVLHATSRSRLFANIILWASIYNLRGFLSRFVGQVMGIPTIGHCRITDSIWVGALPGVIGLVLLKVRGFGGRASLLELKASQKQNRLIEVWAMPIEEFASIPTKKLWEYTDDLLERIKDGKVPLFIHCREGVGRAPAVAAALLMRQGLNLMEALDLVQLGRPVASMNNLQLSSLESFYQELKTRQ